MSDEPKATLAEESWGPPTLTSQRMLLASSPRALRLQRHGRVYAPIFAENQRTRRAAEKVGLRFEGVLRSSLELRARR